MQLGSPRRSKPPALTGHATEGHRSLQQAGRYTEWHGPGTIWPMDPGADPTPDGRYLSRLFADPRATFDASGDDGTALDYLDALRWPNGVKCPRCESEDCYVQPGRLDRRWRRCKACSHQFSPTSATPFSSERLSPSQLLLVVSIASQFTGTALANGIMQATGMTRTAANRLALLLQDLWEAQSADPHHDDAGPRIRSSVPYTADQHWVDPKLGRLTVSSSAGRLAWPVALIATSAAIMVLGAWRAGKFDQVTRTRWKQLGRERIVTTERDPGEGFSDWHFRHRAKVQSFRALIDELGTPAGDSK